MNRAEDVVGCCLPETPTLNPNLVAWLEIEVCLEFISFFVGHIFNMLVGFIFSKSHNVSDEEEMLENCGFSHVMVFPVTAIETHL
jgi:uncharacterized membrane protein YdcZ (DUF606 family)